MINPKRNLTGKQFGRLTVVRCLGRASVTNRNYIYECQCECGTTKPIQSNGLTSGSVQSCGCLQKEMTSARSTTHGDFYSPTYRSWQAMLSRGRHAVRNYKNVTVCDRWNSYELFVSDVGKRPSIKHSIDRWPDRTGNYEPGNVRWATAEQQQRNKSNNRRLTYKGETKCVAEWAEEYGMNFHTLKNRLNRGWSIAKSLETPIIKTGRWT